MSRVGELNTIAFYLTKNLNVSGRNKMQMLVHTHTHAHARTEMGFQPAQGFAFWLGIISLHLSVPATG
jgi:hypothetical protein